MRSKRYGVPRSMYPDMGVPRAEMGDEDEFVDEKRSPWVSLREALDEDHDLERRSATKLVEKVEQVSLANIEI